MSNSTWGVGIKTKMRAHSAPCHAPGMPIVPLRTPLIVSESDYSAIRSDPIYGVINCGRRFFYVVIEPESMVVPQ